MTFAAFETATETGEPIELYVTTIGTDTFRFTNNQIDLTVAALGGTFTPEAIKRTTIAQEFDKHKDRIKVTMPGNNVLAQKYISNPPGQRATMTIYRMHREDLAIETIIIFKGLIQTVQFNKNGREAEISVLALTAAQTQTMPRFTYQGLCNHMLYDARCKLNENNVAHKFTFTVDAVVANVITVVGAGAVTVGSESAGEGFVGGFVEFQSDFRMVTAQGGAGDNDLTLRLPFNDTPLNQSVVCKVGCRNRFVEDCQDKFSNAINFGGFPFVPLKDPFATGLD